MCCIYPMRMLILVINQDLKLIVPNLCVAEKETPVSHFFENASLSIKNLLVPGHTGAGFWYENRHTFDYILDLFIVQGVIIATVIFRYGLQK